MDRSDDPTVKRAPVCRFGPDRRLTAATAGLALVALAAAVLTADRGGRLLFAAAALVLVAYAVTDVVFWPRLTATADGLTVRTPTVRAQLQWSDVEAVKADVRERLGLRSTTLEIDAGDTLVVFSRRMLGADPAAAAALVTAMDPRGR